ncbi:MAG: hypothetical protein KatS3mg105_0512 [Gemmatales bacterium]|nr:MAG: hypothetical protein KatS3mg105_0512 [Gemmatales bacterium]
MISTLFCLCAVPLAPFELFTCDGRVLPGNSFAIETNVIRWYGGKQVDLDLNDVISLSRKQPFPPPPLDEHVVLVNGDIIPGRVARLAGLQLHFHARLADGAEAVSVRIPLANVSLIWLAPPDGVLRYDRYRRRLLAATRRNDNVLLRNGDLLQGVLNELDRKQVAVEMGGRRASAEFGKVAVIAFNSQLVRWRKPKQPYFRLLLANGCRLSLLSAQNKGDRLVGNTIFGAEVRLPTEEIVRLDRWQGCAVFLSDLKPAGYAFTPYLDVEWPWVRDGSVTGRDLQLGKSTFDKGLGMHAASRLRFDLGGDYRRFEALVGMDPKTSREVKVKIRVLVDGKSRFADTLSSTGTAKWVRVDTTAGKELMLVVDFAEHGNVQAHVNWADARLIK